MGLKRFATPINFVLFQAAWFGCVLGAANNYQWLGPVLVFVLVPLQIYFLTEHPGIESLFVLMCGLLGFSLETILIMAGVYIPAGSGNVPICPPWMAALWINFGLLVSISLSWLKGKYLLAAILGGVAGPLAWWGGEKLDALTVADDFVLGYLPLAIIWAVVVPVLLHVHAKIRQDPKG